MMFATFKWDDFAGANCPERVLTTNEGGVNWPAHQGQRLGRNEGKSITAYSAGRAQWATLIVSLVSTRAGQLPQPNFVTASGCFNGVENGLVPWWVMHPGCRGVTVLTNNGSGGFLQPPQLHISGSFIFPKGEQWRRSND